MTNPFFTEQPAEFIAREDGVKIACRYTPGKGTVTLVFLPGYMSDMQGGKAQALAAWAAANDTAMLRLDYSGCGESEGDFADSSISIWRDDVLLAINTYTSGPLVLVGSSMGGWLMLLAALALGDRLAGMVGIAAAPDFTDWGFSDAQKGGIVEEGVILQDNPYGPEPTPTFLKFWQDGEDQKLLGSEISLDCPVRLLHGQADEDVPWDISLKLATALRSEDVQIHLVKDGDHRLSRSQDIDLLIAAVAGLVN